MELANGLDSFNFDILDQQASEGAAVPAGREAAAAAPADPDPAYVAREHAPEADAAVPLVGVSAPAARAAEKETTGSTVTTLTFAALAGAVLDAAAAAPAPSKGGEDGGLADILSGGSGNGSDVGGVAVHGRGGGAAAGTLAPTDNLYGDQWHFTLLGNGFLNLVERIWDEYNGTGVNVGVYDSGVQSIHHDLNDNYNAALHVDIGAGPIPGDPRPNPAAGDAHGTAVAGIIGAELNGSGAVGIAWNANLTGVNIFDPNSTIFINAGDPSNFFLAVGQARTFDVTNHSWGAAPGFFLDNGITTVGTFGFETNAGFIDAAINGRGGLGTITVKSAGNENRDANGDGLNASRFTVTVGALLETGFAASYSNFGANLLISAPGGDTFSSFPNTVNGTRLVTTTDLLGTEGFNTIADINGAQDFTNRMNGTSAAAPMVSGVIALMLDANPDLGWRDVNEILALSAFQTGSGVGNASGLNENHQWFVNGATNWNGGGMHFSEDYGYGNVDLFGAVRLSESFAVMGRTARTLANELTASTGDMAINLAIPDNNLTLLTAGVAVDVTPDLVIDQVQVELVINHTYVSDLEIFLTSPSGTVVQIQDNSFVGGAFSGGQRWSYGVEALRGEQVDGTWTLSFRDVQALDTGSMVSWNLFFFGSAASVDDIHYITDEFGTFIGLDPARALISDTNGGTDWINAAAASSSISVDLESGAINFLGLGAIAPGTIIENVISGDGGDVLTGNAANNRLFGMRGSDTLVGGLGNDFLDGGTGADTMRGGADNDIYVVDRLTDVVDESVAGSSGSDYVRSSNISIDLSNATRFMGAVENAVLDGSANLNLTGNGLINNLVGNSGNNVLNGGANADFMRGLGGNDTYHIDNGGDTVDEAFAGSGGTDNVRSSTINVDLSNSVRFLGAIENIFLEGSANLNATGNGLINSITGNSGNNIIDGLGGNDIMRGLGGNDTYYVQNGGDIVDEAFAGSGGTDTVRSSNVSINLSNSALFLGAIEQVVLEGSSNLQITGNGLANTLIGNSGNNVINGGALGDFMRGLAGSDTYVVDSVNDTVDESFAGSSGHDTVKSSTIDVDLTNAARFMGDIEQIVLEGTANLRATGNDLANTIIGNDGNNLIRGGAGADFLRGNGGLDRFRFDTALGNGNVDTIDQYNIADDQIELASSIFTGLALGTLGASRFFIGTQATETFHRIIYNDVTGALLFDADGVGGAVHTRFATLASGLALTNTEFSVV